MTQQEPSYIARLFTGLLPADRIAAYETLLQCGGVTKDAAAEFLGGAEVVDDLRRTGMAHVVPGTASSVAKFRAVSPELALLGVLADLQFGISEQQKRLLDGHRRLADAQAVASETFDGVAGDTIRVLTDCDEIARASMDLINRARRDYMTLETSNFDTPPSDDSAVEGPAELRRQVRIRSIYDAALAENPVTSQGIERFVQSGEEARVLPKLPIKMKLVDEAAVLLPRTPTGMGGAVLITGGPIPHAMRVFFEMLWLRATPFGSGLPNGPLSDIERKILQLMAAGKQDEAIAAILKCGARTVRRHATEVGERMGLKSPSRFELGFAVAQRGWLTCPKATPPPSKDEHD